MATSRATAAISAFCALKTRSCQWPLHAQLAAHAQVRHGALRAGEVDQALHWGATRQCRSAVTMAALLWPKSAGVLAQIPGLLGTSMRLPKPAVTAGGQRLNQHLAHAA